MKRTVPLLLASILGLSFIGGTISLNGAVEHASKTAENCVLYFDIDDVCIAKKSKEVKAILKKNCWLMVKSITISRVYSACQHYRKNGNSGSGWRVWAKNNYPALLVLIQEIAQSKKPIAGTIALVDELKSLGFKVHAATNMGKDEFLEHKIDEKRFLSELFVSAKTVDYEQKSIIIKPNPIYFQELLADHSDLTKQYKVFIDDKLENVESAKKAGFIGIQFKNPEQCRAELVKIGFNISA